MNHDYIAGLSILGGEPLELVNQQGLVDLVKKVKDKYPEKTIWCYTGYTYEQLITLSKSNKYIMEFLKNIDVLVDGKFILELKSDDALFRGSTNQRIIDVKKSLAQNEVVLWDGINEDVG